MGFHSENQPRGNEEREGFFPISMFIVSSG